MAAPRTTVVIATRDRRDDLARTLANLREHSPGTPIVVVDNGSNDGTPASVRTEFPSIQVLELERNVGSSARNLGVRLAATPYVAARTPVGPTSRSPDPLRDGDGPIARGYAG
jgi:GT2 family glycosyltransferase